jgi:hypothetical protein
MRMRILQEKINRPQHLYNLQLLFLKVDRVKLKKAKGMKWFKSRFQVLNTLLFTSPQLIPIIIKILLPLEE